MKLFYRSIILVVLAATCAKQATAFDSTLRRPVNATILLPLYLDSAFKNGSYRYGNTIPNYILSSLEFYNGVQLAADSLEQEGINARIEIIDTRKQAATDRLFSAYNFFKPELIIGVVQSPGELKMLAGQAQNNNVPFISATYPNDGGIRDNPDLLIVNSTLKTHCMAIYKFMQQNYTGANIVMVVRKNGADERIKAYLKAAEKESGEPRLKWSIASLPEDFTPVQLGVYLDSNKLNKIIGASLDRTFSLKLIETISGMQPTFNCAIFGMPTWDEFPLQKPEYKGVDVYYSTPFISYTGNPDLYKSISGKFKKIANSRPSDMVFRGFEVTYRYIKTLYEHPVDFLQHINDSDAKIFADFRFEPVRSTGEADEVSYWENNKIYFVKKTDGLIKGVY